MNSIKTVGPVFFFVGLATLVFILLPLPFIVLYSFSPNAYSVISADGFTLKWFESFFSNDRFMMALQTSFSIAAVTTVVSLIIAVPTAVMAVRNRFFGRDLLLTFVSAPLMVPGVIVGTAALGFVSQTGVGPGF